MTKAEITAKDISINLHSALEHLRAALLLIDDVEHSIAWANTTTAIDKTDRAIRMLRQDYANSNPAFLEMTK